MNIIKVMLNMLKCIGINVIAITKHPRIKQIIKQVFKQIIVYIAGLCYHM